MSRRVSDSTGLAMANSSIADYELFRDFLQDSCGILLGDNKQYLVASRINKLMKNESIKSLGELVDKMKKISYRKLKDAVIDAMTTNETLWFRDNYPFEIFKNKLMIELEEKKTSPIRIWSAACSSGQEPYSLSMLIEEHQPVKNRTGKSQVEIVATDLSQSMLNSCNNAEYDELSVGRGLSKNRLECFFEKLDNGIWRVIPEVKQRVHFQPLNLMDSFFSLGKFDVVFCRNVLIYFSAALKTDILRRIHGTLHPGGYLILGASEGPTDVSELYQIVQCKRGIIYQAV